jgi:hypothetical protein
MLRRALKFRSLLKMGHRPVRLRENNARKRRVRSRIDPQTSLSLNLNFSIGGQGRLTEIYPWLKSFGIFRPPSGIVGAFGG